MTDAHTTSLSDLLAQDALPDAVEAAIARVKAAPQDAGARMALAQLAALSGDLPRAETHARMAQTLDPARATTLAEFRQYLRALEARAAWWNDAATPGFPDGPTMLDQQAMALHVASRAGDAQAAAKAAQALEAARAPCPARWDETQTDDLRDVDDRLPHALEALTPGGHYLWLDLARVATVEFGAVLAPFDLLARPARVELRDGAAADLRLVAIYDEPRNPGEQLGRVTEFSELSPGLIRAHGQRSFLVGDDMAGLLSPSVLVMANG
ncbi:type VI secretion system accessory protein TagJ [Gymnodinialimonas sp. 2305UL16-5]|uniref:type VI secretion system accessory protein TagJ n=1 Tax=Gymnodinialimonas mytili TaxID=3126503 RepID=UPI0030962267